MSGTAAPALAAPIEIAAGLWRIGGGSWNGRSAALSAEADANVYLLSLGKGHALVDCGTLAGLPLLQANLNRLDPCAAETTDLLLTHAHWDHSEAAASLQADRPGLRTHLNSIGSEHLERGDHRLVGYQITQPPHHFRPFRVDHKVLDNAIGTVGAEPFTAYHLPGHTPDSTLYTLRRDGLNVGFSGDIVFQCRAAEAPVLGQLCSLWLSNLDDYVVSLRRLLEIEIDLLLPGHGDPVRGRKHVQQTILQTLALAIELAGDKRVRENVGV